MYKACSLLMGNSLENTVSILLFVGISFREGGNLFTKRSVREVGMEFLVGKEKHLKWLNREKHCPLD